MQCLEIETLSTFNISEEFDRKSNQYFKDRTDGFDNYYPCIRNQCTLFYVQNIIEFFICMFNNVTTTGNDFNFEFNEGEITLA